MGHRHVIGQIASDRVNSMDNSAIGLDGQFRNWNWLFTNIGIDNVGIEVSYKKLNPQINLPFIF